MFEITREHEDALDYFINEQIAYSGAEYDFTFEGRFLIYHVTRASETSYYAIDMKTNLTSEVCHRKNAEFMRDNYSEMIPLILKSIKYTGDNRYQNPFAPNPLAMIDTIFRVILRESGYAVREEQIKLCKDIYEGLTRKRVAICEAEVGIGKSLAYLVAAICARKTHDVYMPQTEPVTITTSNIELQNSLIYKEIPRLSAILQKYGIIDKPLAAALRKGREHYFCRLRYEDYLWTIKRNPRKYASRIALLESERFTSGQVTDLDKVSMPVSLKDRICAKGECKYCPYEDSCPYATYVAKAMSKKKPMDFQVTNHNLYLMSTQKSNLLRESSCVIVDEAHKLKDAAQEVFGERVREHDVMRYLNFIKIRCDAPASHERFKATLDYAANLNSALFVMLSDLVGDHPTERGEIVSLPQQCHEVISDLMDSLLVLESLREEIKGKQLINGRKIADSLQVFLKPSAILTWVEKELDGELSLCCCPKDIGSHLLEDVWDKDKSHVLTSGTMSDGTSFEFFKRENGIASIPKSLILEAMTESPFDYKNHTRLYIPNDLPFPDNGDDDYINAIADRIVELIEATNGHTAILFTSYKLLQAIHTRTKDRLQKYDVFMMTKSNKNAINAFKKSKNGVIFASGSMWEGVDFVGDCLSSVIIVRLPFPMRSVTMEEKKNASKNVPQFIADYAVPEMLIKLRQGAGRLIRSEQDTGVLSILDSRASENGAYSRKVRQALRKYPMVSTIDEVHDFMKSVKQPDYFEILKETEEEEK